MTSPDVKQYKNWDLETTMVWVKSLDSELFAKYGDVLRTGFESDGIPASELPNIGRGELATDPFNIRAFMDRKKLAECFKSLGNNEIAEADEGGHTAYI